jgi:hypothetical protein
METVEIRSILRDIALLIRDPQKNGELTSLTVQIAGRDATHLTITSAISNPAKLSQFFSRLVTERLEWGAERRWESDQRDFALAAGVDRPGRLNLSATLRGQDASNATATLVLENSDLKEIAADVKALLGC